MKFSRLFTKTLREAPAEEQAINAQYLIRGGFAFKNSAGVYTYLPLGWRVARKISDIVREEMNAVGGQELFMPSLVEKKYMEPTGRWNLDVGFFALDDKPRSQEVGAPTKASEEASFVLGWSHEEVLTAIASRYTNSYKDLPFAAYQIQTKFRNEARAKSGLLRGREFMMKDLYSFHTDEKDLMRYYQEVADAYLKIFSRCGLKAYYTLAAGGVFTISNTHEFQVLSPVGEDTVMVCKQCDYAENVEVSELKDGDPCPKCQTKVTAEKSIEVGNIFPLGTKYSVPLGLEYVDESGNTQPAVMGSYGIGIGRLMATVVETSYDANGIMWPESIAPFKVHLVSLNQKEEADKIYSQLQSAGVEVLYDDREDKSAGEKFADADLIGCPMRVVVSKKTLEKNSIEIKLRSSSDASLVSLDEVVKAVNS